MKNRSNLVLLACIMLIFSACGQEAAPPPINTKVEEQLNTPVIKEKDKVQTTPDADPTPVVVADSTPEVAQEQFEVFDPSEALSEEEIIQLGADGFSGSDKEIAQAILDWQGQYMQLNTEADQQFDISHPMRWNYFLPGIFPVKEMVKERVLENGKIYGICYDYAAIFSAIANYYGLETRITAHKVYVRESGDIPWPNESEAGTGLLRDEYEALQPKLEKNNLSLSYAQVNRAAKETFGHYRAEVNIDGEWVAFDGAPLRSNAGLVFQVMDWDDGYDPDLLYAEVPFSDVDIPALAELLTNAPQPGYEGITDDAGNEHRAANMEDLIAGKGLVPYFQDLEDMAKFLQIQEGDENGLMNLSELFEIKGEYEAGTGNLFYVIADM
ncbi:hypothetical protein KA005_18630, partial [bacterium]|nr:hypothetical protein [bacterium]